MKRKTASQGYYQAGVSLVELMVGLTIGLIITAGAFAALFSNQKLILEKDKMDRSQENFRFASTTITRLVRQATSFGFPENNNELVVYFDSKQRDCLGEPNHSSVNTFKLNTDNELLCELVLNDGTTKTVTLAKNIAALKFAYGIQDGTGTTPLAYQPYLNSSGTVNSAVDAVWGTITSVLSEISLEDGNAKHPTTDFIATSHLRAMTQLASTGGTSLVNPPSSTTPPPTPPPTTPPTTPPPTTPPTTPPPTTPPPTTPNCPNDMLANITLTYDIGENKKPKLNTKTWANMSSSTNVFKGTSIKLEVNPSVGSTLGWKVKAVIDGSESSSTLVNKDYSLPDGNGKEVTLTLTCSTEITTTLKFVTTN